MVLSKINATVNYIETKKIHKDDIKKEVDLYEVEIKDIDIIIALGNMRNQYEEENILFYPIYLVKHNNKVIQIGLYEIKSSNYEYYLDKYGKIDIDKLSEPIIYSFATKEMLEKLRKKPETDTEPEPKHQYEKDDSDNDSEKGDEKEDDKGDKYDIPEERRDIFILTTGFHVPELLQEETKKVSKDIIEKYKEDKDDNWMQKFMKNPHFTITDNEGGGDCFFATIRDAFSSIGQQTTVKKLRDKLASEATQEIFMGYKEQYDLFYLSIASDTSKIKELSKEYQTIKDKIMNILDRDEKNQMLIKAKDIKSTHDRLVEDKKTTNRMLTEYTFMKGLDTLEKFKKKIKTCDFWGETWAISTMERVLNIKFILMSNEAYRNQDLKNVLQCGHMNDTILEQRGAFNPEFYIMVEYTGNHYKLIGYKNKQIFKFGEIPYSIKKLVVNKCLERNSGIFSLISEFMQFKEAMNLRTPKNAVEKSEEFTEAKLRGLYDDEVVFIYYNKSNNVPLPGKGTGEKIPKEFIKEFTGLHSIHEWRRKLSNFWIAPFTLDNHRWSSVEHYYNACKYKKTNPEFYLSFAIESGTELSANPEMAKAAGSKQGKFEKILVRPKQVIVDEDYTEERENKNIYDAQFAKFTQNPELTQLLIQTKNAKLMKFKSGKEPELDNTPMLVRDKIMKR